MIRKKRAQAVIIHRGKILLTRHFDQYVNEHYWCLPGGGIEPGESPEQAVVRELAEETGLTVRVIGRLSGDYYAGVYQGYHETHTFFAEATGGALKLGYDPEYAGWAVPFLQEVRWVPIEGALLRQLEAFWQPGDRAAIARWQRLRAKQAGEDGS